MPPEQLDKLRVIGLTALVTSVTTLLVAAGVVTYITRQPPPTPHLAPPKSITVTLYPSTDFTCAGCPPTTVPPGDVDTVMHLLTPDKYYEGGVNDLITPLVAEVSITHESQPDTKLLVRWTGVNPAAVSTDGRHYFYATHHHGEGDGTVRLISLIRRINEAKSR